MFMSGCYNFLDDYANSNGVVLIYTLEISIAWLQVLARTGSMGRSSLF